MDAIQSSHDAHRHREFSAAYWKASLEKERQREGAKVKSEKMKTGTGTEISQREWCSSRESDKKSSIKERSRKDRKGGEGEVEKLDGRMQTR